MMTEEEKDRDIVGGLLTSMGFFALLVLLAIYDKMNGITSHEVHAGMALCTVFVTLGFIAGSNLIYQEVFKAVLSFRTGEEYSFYNRHIIVLFSFIFCIFLWIFLIDWSFAQYAGLPIGGMVGLKLSRMIYNVIRIKMHKNN